MKNLLVIMYNDCYGNGGDTSIECITDDFDRWFEEHNKSREEEGEMEEKEDEFDVIEMCPIIYNKERKER